MKRDEMEQDRPDPLRPRVEAPQPRALNTCVLPARRSRPCSKPSPNRRHQRLWDPEYPAAAERHHQRGFRQQPLSKQALDYRCGHHQVLLEGAFAQHHLHHQRQPQQTARLRRAGDQGLLSQNVSHAAGIAGNRQRRPHRGRISACSLTTRRTPSWCAARPTRWHWPAK